MPETWPGHPSQWSASLDYAAAQTNATLRAAAPSGRRLVITWLVISNGAVAGNVTLLDGSGGSVLFEIYPAINGGVALDNLHIELTEATLLALTSTTVTTHAVNVGGFSEPI